MHTTLKVFLCSCLISSSAFASAAASSSSSSSDDLIFSSQKIRTAYQTHLQHPDATVREWTQAKDQLLLWTQGVAVPISKPNYRQAEQFYIQKIGTEAKELARTLEGKKWEFVFHTLDHLATLENSLRITLEDAKIDSADLGEEELIEVRRVVSSEEKVHANRQIPPDADRCFEAIVVKRTRLANSDTMVDMGQSDLDVPSLVSFNCLPKHKTEETTDTSLDFTVSTEPSINVKHNVNSKYVITVDAYKSIYQMTANSFYRGSDFRLKYNKSDGFLFLMDLTILGETSVLKSVSQGTKSKVDPKLLKSIEEKDSTQLPKKIDLIFDFTLGTEKALVFQMRLKEKKTKFFIAEGKDSNEWMVSFVRSKDPSLVSHLINDVLSKETQEKAVTASQ